MNLPSDQIRRIEALSKIALILEVKEWASRNGQRWVFGGPENWSKQELVSAVCRIRRDEAV